MNSAGTPPRLLILSGDLAGNTGDRAIRSVLMGRIRTIAPEATVYAVSREPARDEGEFGVQVVARSAAYLLGMPRFLSSLTGTIFGGGQLLQDDSSQMKNIHWSTVLQGVRWHSRRPIWGCGLGIGPLLSATGRWSARGALRALDGCLARDQRSADWAARFMPAGAPVDIAPDPALALIPADRRAALRYLTETEQLPLHEEELVIGVAVRRFFPGRRGILPSAWTAHRYKDTQGFDRFNKHLASALNNFARNRNLRVLFFPFYRASWQDDAVHARSVAEQLDFPSHVLRLNCTSGMVKALQGCCDLFLGVPMHSTILAMGADVPTLGIAYADKTMDLFADVGLQDCVLPAERVYAPDGAVTLYQALQHLHHERDRIHNALKEHKPRIEKRIHVYDEWLRRALYPADTGDRQ